LTYTTSVIAIQTNIYLKKIYKIRKPHG